eukprot:CAMPEP_0175601594 /NCGR_PEP_ID=MMETSP0096-20121207/58200_1 /TAXON_ID=311494 /ORGANISM="Alexandrium monilatum, Strain CCMP3105" /LENGTH=132 /DNA_ID=CAMNT_0016906237 /DNA_START=88 /DNA_END=483 /DNA_ORIENTATION=+
MAQWLHGCTTTFFLSADHAESLVFYLRTPLPVLALDPRQRRGKLLCKLCQLRRGEALQRLCFAAQPFQLPRPGLRRGLLYGGLLPCLLQPALGLLGVLQEPPRLRSTEHCPPALLDATWPWLPIPTSRGLGS